MKGKERMNQVNETARAVFQHESKAISAVAERLDLSFDRAVEMICNCPGRVVLFGVGKSGHVGHRVAATMASLGIPAFFVHAGESHHGDIGSITGDDVVIAISYGGESDEILIMLPVLDRIGAKLIAITGKPLSTLATHADIVLDTGPDLGEGMIGWAHLCSIAASMAMGDALAITAAMVRGFEKDSFALYHPGGSYGKELRQSQSNDRRSVCDTKRHHNDSSGFCSAARLHSVAAADVDTT
jgi:arabinose-5-phosphate isomerase